MAHAAAEMFGCTEYGVLSAEQWEIGYYDRIDDRYCEQMKRAFDQSSASVNPKLDKRSIEDSGRNRRKLQIDRVGVEKKELCSRTCCPIVLYIRGKHTEKL